MTLRLKLANKLSVLSLVVLAFTNVLSVKSFDVPPQAVWLTADCIVVFQKNSLLFYSASLQLTQHVTLNDIPESALGIVDLFLSPNANHIALGIDVGGERSDFGYDIEVWDIDMTFKKSVIRDRDVYSFVWLPDSQSILVGERTPINRGALRFYDAFTGLLQREILLERPSYNISSDMVVNQNNDLFSDGTNYEIFDLDSHPPVVTGRWQEGSGAHFGLASNSIDFTFSDQDNTTALSTIYLISGVDGSLIQSVTLAKNEIAQTILARSNGLFVKIVANQNRVDHYSSNLSAKIGSVLVGLNVQDINPEGTQALVIVDNRVLSKRDITTGVTLAEVNVDTSFGRSP